MAVGGSTEVIMAVSLLYFGPEWVGSTSLQRLTAFSMLDDVEAVGVDSGSCIGVAASLWHKIRWRMRVPVDVNHENQTLITAVRSMRPQVVVVDNSKVIRRSTLEKLRAFGVRRIVYYSPDDIAARHNLSLPLRSSLRFWDIVCTTKTFNVPELRAMGVARPFLVGKAYDPDLHKPHKREDVGNEFELFDAVFVGTFEKERCQSINALAESGVSVVVYGEDKGNWRRERLHAAIELRPSVFGQEYVRAWHTGKVALCFLRKINRDRITQRTMEIAAMGRPMVGERTDEHDTSFQHGEEYLGFLTDSELVTHVRALLEDEALRNRMGGRARLRCLESGYSTHDRARQMMNEFMR